MLCKVLIFQSITNFDESLKSPFLIFEAVTSCPNPGGKHFHNEGNCLPPKTKKPSLGWLGLSVTLESAAKNVVCINAISCIPRVHHQPGSLHDVLVVIAGVISNDHYTVKLFDLR